jgi:23S rRNA (uracil1939-C5)-methyltransferase
MLAEAVAEEMGEIEGLEVLDAYCGIGEHGRRAARGGARSVGIEADPGAVRIARAFQGEGFQILEGTVEDRLADTLPVDLAVLNPPRAGVEEGVMERLAASGARRLVYVSCDPATLARDVARAGDAYAIRSVRIFDLFPQTARVETLLVLERE